MRRNSWRNLTTDGHVLSADFRAGSSDDSLSIFATISRVRGDHHRTVWGRWLGPIPSVLTQDRRDVRIRRGFWAGPALSGAGLAENCGTNWHSVITFGRGALSDPHGPQRVQAESRNRCAEPGRRRHSPVARSRGFRSVTVAHGPYYSVCHRFDDPLMHLSRISGRLAPELSTPEGDKKIQKF